MEEQNVNIEAAEVAPVEEAPVEAVAEQAPPEGEVAAEVQPAPEPDLSLDFGEPAPAQQYQQPVQENYDEIVDELAEKLMQKQGLKSPATEVDEGEEFLTRSQVKDLKEEIRRELQEEAVQKQQAEQYVQQVVAQNQGVKQEYVQQMDTKLKALGVDWEQNVALKKSADLVWRNLEGEAQRQVGRMLTPQETNSLKQYHWQEFSETFVKPLVSNGTPVQPAAGGEGLGLGGVAVNEQPQNTAQQTDPMAEYRRRKAAGEKMSPMESIEVLNRLSGKN